MELNFNLPPGTTTDDLEPGSVPIDADDINTCQGCGAGHTRDSALCARCALAYEIAEAKRDYGR